MTKSNDRDVLAQDTRLGNDGDLAGVAQPISQAEIDDLLYGEEWDGEERIARLLALREELSTMEAADFGGNDPAGVVNAIDAALGRLEGLKGKEMRRSSVDHNPEDHRETLAPDSDELEALEADDEDSLEDLDEVLEEAGWVDGDGLDRDKDTQ